MTDTLILRRRKLGRTSCREVAKFIQGGATIWRNDQPRPEGDFPCVIRWGCTFSLGGYGGRVLNTADAIHRVNDKGLMRWMLRHEGINPASSFLHTSDIYARLDYEIPMVARPVHHSQGRNVHMIHTELDFLNLETMYGTGGFYVSEVYEKQAEYRVFVVQGRVACVAKKTPGDPLAFAWNVAQGGRFDNVRWGDWPLTICKAAVEAASLVKGLTFTGVDVIDATGIPVVLELNSAPSLTSPYRQSCMGKALNWAVQGGDVEEVKFGEVRTWKDLIHPAVREVRHEEA